MSFRARLTIFFVLIVIVPMAAIGILMFRLIDDSEQGKADARVTALAAAAGTLYESEAASARTDAGTLGRAIGSRRGKALSTGFAALAMQAGLARATLSDGSRTLVDVGGRSAIAPGLAILRNPAGGRVMTMTVSELTASQYARELPPDLGVVVRQGPKVLTATLPVANPASLPRSGSITLDGKGYRAVSQTFTGFGGAAVTVTVMSALSATVSSPGGSRALASLLIIAFLVLALGFSLLASRALQGRLTGFLEAARRLGSGDFSAPIRVEGNDEFAALGAEFNSMSSELSRRLDELSRERGRLSEAIRRTGRTFASSLDRPALLELVLKTAVDAVQGSGGRISSGQTITNRSPSRAVRGPWPSRRPGARCGASRAAERWSRRDPHGCDQCGGGYAQSARTGRARPWCDLGCPAWAAVHGR